MHRSVKTTGILVMLAMTILSGDLAAQTTQYGVPVTRLERLRRGFNASLIYYGKYDVTSYKTLKSQGYDHVRVTIKPNDIYNSSDGTVKSTGITTLKAVAANAKAAGLAAMVCVHKNQSYAINPRTDNFVKFCGNYAKQLSTTDPEYLFLESVNEPLIEQSPTMPLYDTDSWNIWMNKIAVAMRANAPNHTIVLSSSIVMGDTTRMGGDAHLNWDQIDCLTIPKMTLPAGVTNCIMTVHYYPAMTYTHQNTALSFFSHIKDVAYPANEANCQSAINRVQSTATGQTRDWATQNIKDYLYYWSDRGHYDEKMKQVALWRQKHDNIYVHIGEFGANGYATKGRDLYFKDIVTAMEKYNLGWAHWCQSYGPDRTWVGLDKSLPAYDPNKTGLNTVGITNSRSNYRGEENLTSEILYRSEGSGSPIETRIFDLSGKLNSRRSAGGIHCVISPNGALEMRLPK